MTQQEALQRETVEREPGREAGRLARLATFWALAVLIFYGCTSLRATLVGNFESLAKPLVADFPRVPVLGIELTAAFLIAAVVFAGAMFLVWRWIEKPKNSLLLAETETEMRKVTWPSATEVTNSSIVVVVCVAFLMAYLASADWTLAQAGGGILFSERQVHTAVTNLEHAGYAGVLLVHCAVAGLAIGSVRANTESSSTVQSLAIGACTIAAISCYFVFINLREANGSALAYVLPFAAAALGLVLGFLPVKQLLRSR